jgi:hypothetical protein
MLDSMLLLSYQPLTTRTRQYADWLLLRRTAGMCPLPLRRVDMGQESFDALLASGKTIVVPPGAAKVLQSIQELMLLDYKRASAVLEELWMVCDQQVIHLHPNESYTVCLRRLIKEYAEELMVPETTQTSFHMDMGRFIRDMKDHGDFARPFSDMAVEVIAQCDYIHDWNNIEND